MVASNGYDKLSSDAGAILSYLVLDAAHEAKTFIVFYQVVMLPNSLKFFFDLLKLVTEMNA
jgi:hypothetical protein